MITTICQVNIHYHTSVNFYLVMGTMKVYSHSKFQRHNTVLLIRISMLYILSPGLIYFIIEILCIWPPLPSSLNPTSTSVSHQPVLCIWVPCLVIVFVVLDCTHSIRLWDHTVLVCVLFRWFNFISSIIQILCMCHLPYSIENFLYHTRVYENSWSFIPSSNIYLSYSLWQVT